jgi:hypothetical protein
MSYSLGRLGTSICQEVLIAGIIFPIEVWSFSTLVDMIGQVHYWYAKIWLACIEIWLVTRLLLPN